MLAVGAGPDETLLAALSSTLDRVDYALSVGDGELADVMGGVVAVLLRAPGAGSLGDDVRWRRQLVRWSQVRCRIGAPPAALTDFVIGRARLYLVEAARAAGGLP